MNLQKTLSHNISCLNSKIPKVSTPPRILPLRFQDRVLSRMWSSVHRSGVAACTLVQHMRCRSFFLPRLAGLLWLNTFLNMRRTKPTCIYHLSLFPLQTAWDECKLTGSSHRILFQIQGCGHSWTGHFAANKKVDPNSDGPTGSSAILEATKGNGAHFSGRAQVSADKKEIKCYILQKDDEEVSSGVSEPGLSVLPTQKPSWQLPIGVTQTMSNPSHRMSSLLC